MLTISIVVFVSVSCLALLVLEHYLVPAMENRRRLQGMGEDAAQMTIKSGVEVELQVSFRERVFKPLMAKMSEISQKYTPIRQKDTIEEKLNNAGRPFGWEAADYVTIQFVSAIGMAVTAYLFSVFIMKSGYINQFLSILVGFALGTFLVDFLLKNHINQRQEAIKSELPDVLDLLTVSIEAGLGFDAAMQRVVQKSKGPLSEEFSQTLQEMRMGKTRRDALKDLGERNGVDDLSKFIEALIQADQLGVSLGNVLRNQSDQMRVLRRQRVEEKAMKAPVKMLIPLVVFIFPCIFVIALAPAFVKMSANL